MNESTGKRKEQRRESVRKSVAAAESDEHSEIAEASDPVVSVDGLAKQYGGEDGVEAVKGVDFEIGRGTAVGILGPNGAGKTTTIKCMLGLIVPTAGETRIDGLDVQEDSKTVYQRIGATFEGARNVYWRLSVKENLDFFAALAGNDPRERQERHEQLLSQFGLTEKTDTVVRELSRGQKQKTALACALARDADFLFLDEPTLGLDVESSIELRKELKRLVKEDDTTVMVSSHDMDVIEDVCDRVVIINDGEVVTDDTVDNLIDVFDTKQYEIGVTGELPDRLRRELQSRFDVEAFETHSDITRFVASVSDGGLYNLVGLLDEAPVSIDSVETVLSLIHI